MGGIWSRTRWRPSSSNIVHRVFYHLFEYGCNVDDSLEEFSQKMKQTMWFFCLSHFRIGQNELQHSIIQVQFFLINRLLNSFLYQVIAFSHIFCRLLLCDEILSDTSCILTKTSMLWPCTRHLNRVRFFWHVLTRNNLMSSADLCIGNKTDFSWTKWTYGFILLWFFRKSISSHRKDD